MRLTETLYRNTGYLFDYLLWPFAQYFSREVSNNHQPTPENDEIRLQRLRKFN